MFNRPQIKRGVRDLIRGRWASAFLAAFLVSCAVGAATFVITRVTAFGPVVVSIVALPLSVSLTGYFLKFSRGQNPQLGEAFACFDDRFTPYLTAMAFRWLWTLLWTLLFVIPGIIKAIAYSFVPYIIYENPNVGAQRAIKLSMEITRGYKAELFVLYLSFFLWFMLGAITMGIAYIYVVPYVYTTITIYYDKLKQRAIADGRVAASEFSD